MFVGKIFFKMATPGRTYRIAQGLVVQQPDQRGGQRGFVGRRDQQPRNARHRILRLRTVVGSDNRAARLHRLDERQTAARFGHDRGQHRNIGLRKQRSRIGHKTDEFDPDLRRQLRRQGTELRKIFRVVGRPGENQREASSPPIRAQARSNTSQPFSSTSRPQNSSSGTSGASPQVFRKSGASPPMRPSGELLRMTVVRSRSIAGPVEKNSCRARSETNATRSKRRYSQRCSQSHLARRTK